MKLKEILNEKTKESDREILVSFFNRVYNGNIDRMRMQAAGFNMRNPSANKEYNLAQTLSTVLKINITEDDVKNALRELRIKSPFDLVNKWLEGKQGN